MSIDPESTPQPPERGQHTLWEARPTGQLFKDGILIGQFNIRYDAALARNCVNSRAALADELRSALASMTLNWEQTGRVIAQVVALGNFNEHIKKMLIAAHGNMLAPMARADDLLTRYHATHPANATNRGGRG